MVAGEILIRMRREAMLLALAMSNAYGKGKARPALALEQKFDILKSRLDEFMFQDCEREETHFESIDLRSVYYGGRFDIPDKAKEHSDHSARLELKRLAGIKVSDTDHPKLVRKLEIDTDRLNVGKQLAAEKGLSVDEAARRLGLAPSTLYRHLRRSTADASN